MELLDITGKIIDLCTLDSEQNDSIKKLKLTLEILQGNSQAIEDAKINSNL